MNAPHMNFNITRAPFLRAAATVLMGFSILLDAGFRSSTGGLNAAEAPHIRQPPPSAAEIAKLPKDGGKEFNRLVFEQSPYLLQHCRNPVDWYPWGEEAFKRAKEEDKPVFLSIGYSTCHWCHVMEHECFEDEEVGEMLNENFICIKVDREERPDIDNVYMTYTQALTGSGGWPMTVFLTPDKKPFHAGTYFPKHSQGRQTGLMDLGPQVAMLWADRREDLLKGAEEAARTLKQIVGGAPGDSLGQEVLDAAFKAFARDFDGERGGFGRFDPRQGRLALGTKFPTPHNLMFLLRYWKRSGEEEALRMTEKTLDAMRAGGMWDHIGHGTHRYSMDPYWVAPHFEKMLYDQALLAIANVEAFQATGKAKFRRTAEEILTYVLRDMTSKEGGFYSAEDADSEGVEGKFYLWTEEELRKLLGDGDGDVFVQVFAVEKEGNYEDERTHQKNGTNIPQLKKTVAEHAKDLGMEEEALAGKIEEMRAKLFAVREKREHPYKDDKILTDWNGLMIAALAKAGQAFDEPKYTMAATKAGDFLLKKLRGKDGRLHKRYRGGKAGLPGHLEDYAFSVWGLIDLYEATFDARFLQAAVELNDAMLKHFWDAKGGGLFLTADDGEALLVRSKEVYDGAIPSGNSVAALNLVRLARMTGKMEYESKADALIKAFSGAVSKGPRNNPMLLLAVDFLVGPAHEIVIAGKAGADDTKAMLAELRKRFLPNKVVVFRPDGDAPEISRIAAYTKNQGSFDGRATAYVCQNFACKVPTQDPKVMLKSLENGED